MIVNARRPKIIETKSILRTLLLGSRSKTYTKIIKGQSRRVRTGLYRVRLENRMGFDVSYV